MTFPGPDCWDIDVFREGVLWASWKGINAGKDAELDASGNGHHLIGIVGTTITERLDGSGTMWANDAGFTVADGTQYFDSDGETLITTGWRMPALVDGSGCAAYQYATDELKRKPVVITNTGSALADYQQLITVSYDTNMKTDFSDIRFRLADGTELPSWIESKTDSATADFYVKVPTAPPGDTIIYCYYGNTTASDVSNISNTFAYADDFESPVSGIFANNIPLVIPTYDGSGQTVHPSVLYFPAGWHGYKYWMAITPHAGDDASTENPSILASDDGATWVTPSGGSNPVVPFPGTGHNYDPCLFYNASTDELWMYYGENLTTVQKLYVKKSSDGVNWSAPILTFSNDVGTISYVSPAIEKVSDTYYLWYQNANNAGQMLRWSSSDGVGWENPIACSGVLNCWHMSIRWVAEKSKYLMFVAATSGGYSQLYTSSDGLAWTATPNIAIPPASWSWDTRVYASSAVYFEDTDSIKIWYSAWIDTPEWHTSVTDDIPYDTVISGSGTNWARIQGTGFHSRGFNSTRGETGLRILQTTGTAYMVRSTSDVIAGVSGIVASIDFFDEMVDPYGVAAFKIYSSLGQKIGLGVASAASLTKYAYHAKNFAWAVTNVDRTPGWHKFTIVVKPDSSIVFFIDNAQVGSLSGQFNDPTKIEFLGSFSGVPVYYDDLRTLKYVEAMPVVAFSAEETL